MAIDSPDDTPASELGSGAGEYAHLASDPSAEKSDLEKFFTPSSAPSAEAARANLDQIAGDTAALAEHDTPMTDEERKAAVLELLESPRGLIPAAELIAGRRVGADEITASLSELVTSQSSPEMKYDALIALLKPEQPGNPN